MEFIINLQNSGYNNGNQTRSKYSHVSLDNSKGLVCSGGPVGSGPLYSNLGDYPPYILDPEIHAHLLPLQQYILEQAKLSGNINFEEVCVSDVLNAVLIY